MRDIGFRLIIIEITDKVFHRIIGKKLFKLPIELCSQRFVVGNDQGRLFHPLNQVGHGKGFTAPGNAQKGLELLVLDDTFYQLFNCFRLITSGFIFGNQFKIGHHFLFSNLVNLERQCKQNKL